MGLAGRHGYIHTLGWMDGCDSTSHIIVTLGPERVTFEVISGHHGRQKRSHSLNHWGSYYIGGLLKILLGGIICGTYSTLH